MDQRAINQAEWENLENWGHPWLGFYFSKKDTRTWVPKRIPWMGWTLNLAHTAGSIWLLGFIIGLPLIPIAIIVIASVNGAH